MVGGGHNGLTAAAYLARRQSRPRARAARAGRRGVHPRAAVHRPRLAGQPVRLPRRPAAPGRRRASSTSPATATARNGPTLTSGVPSTTARRSRCGTTASARLRRWRRWHPPTWTATSPTPTCSRAYGGRCAITAPSATRGSATRPPVTRSRRGSGTTGRRSMRCSTRRSPTSSSTTCATSGCAPPSTVRGSSAPLPARGKPALPASTPTTLSAFSTAWRADGATSTAAWDASRSPSPMLHTRPGRSSRPAFPSPASSPARA